MGEPQPVCLLAHNGYRFDFPLLQAHTKILGKVYIHIKFIYFYRSVNFLFFKYLIYVLNEPSG